MPATPTDTDAPSFPASLDPETLYSPIEKVSPTELGLESLRKKLETGQTIASQKVKKAEQELGEARSRIEKLKEQIATLETETLDARDAMNQAMGLAYALQRTVKELRQEETGEAKGGGVGELRILIEAEEHRVRELAVTLVGESPYTDEFLSAATIDEGKAGGLVFNIKNDLRQKVTEKLTVVTKALQARVPRNHPEYEKRERAYQDAEDHYRNASVDLANAESQRDSLREQIQHSLSTIAALNEAVTKADRVAVRIEEQGKEHEEEDLKKASDSFDQKTAAAAKAKHALAAAEVHEEILEALVAECIREEERLRETIQKVNGLYDLINSAVELCTKTPYTLGRPLLGVGNVLNKVVSEAKADIDPAVVQIAPSLQEKISYAVGHGAGFADGASAALEKALDALYGLLDRFESAVTTADTEEADNLNWEAIGTMLECGRELDQFLRNEWQRLPIGTPEGFYKVIDKARSDVEKALEPLSVLRKAFAKETPATAAPTEPEQAITPAEPAQAPAEKTAATEDAEGLAAQPVAAPQAPAAEEPQEKPAEAAAEAADLPSEPTKIGTAPAPTPVATVAREKSAEPPFVESPPVDLPPPARPRKRRGAEEE